MIKIFFLYYSNYNIRKFFCNLGKAYICEELKYQVVYG